MPKVRFREAVEYMGRQEYTIDNPLIMPGPAGIEFRPSGIMNDDGSFDLCLVPWDNIVSFTSAMMPGNDSDDDTVQ